MKEPRNKKEFDLYIKKLGYYTKKDVREISIGTFLMGLSPTILIAIYLLLDKIF